MRFLKFITLITFQSFILLSFFGVAIALPSKTTHSTVKSKIADVKSVDTIQPKEEDAAKNHNLSGWNGSYVGVNAGTSFGANAGTNLVIPLGSDEK